MGKTLVIIESPGKVAKLQSILGDKYEIIASVGHIIDLDPKRMSIDIKNDFTPQYIVIPPNKEGKFGKKEIVTKLMAATKKADKVILAADEDREGEMIAWSLAYQLKLKNPQRIVYHSVTKDEILKAIANPRKIDEAMVNAQKTRRILDRLVGYEITPVLISSLNQRLSAGRVQSVVVRLIVDRETDIKDFFQKGESAFFKFYGTFGIDKQLLKAVLMGGDNTITEDKPDIIADDEEEEEKIETKGSNKVTKIKTESEATELMKLLTKSEYKIHSINEKASIRQASAPFTTSTLQQEASRKLGLTVKRTMTAAQHLYEEGHITYMRTDSVNLSKEALENIQKYVLEKYGEKYYNPKQFTKKNENTQEAHEAIRPTYVETTELPAGNKIGNDEVRLYTLIWKRTVASQMSAANFNITTIDIKINKTEKYYFRTLIENLVFEGYLIVYNIKNEEPEVNNDEMQTFLKNIKLPKVGTVVSANNLLGQQEFKRPPSRYNEASLVNKLDPKNLNIGRPSTYATIIQKIQDIGYVTKKNVDGIEKDIIVMLWDTNQNKLTTQTKKIVLGKEKDRLVPTILGTTVTDFLMKYFPDIMDYQFTAKMEKKLDDIALNKVNWVDVLKEFYAKFHPLVEQVSSLKLTTKPDYERILGKDPISGNDIVITRARDVPVIRVAIDKKNAIFIDILNPETITLAEAIKIISNFTGYPKLLGKHVTHEIILKKGPTGLYLSYDGKTYSVGKDTDPTLLEAIEIIENKKKDILLEVSDDKRKYTVLIGPYGPYIRSEEKPKGKTKGKVTFIPIPLSEEEKKSIEDKKMETKDIIKKKIEKKELTLEKILELVANKYKRKDTYVKSEKTEKRMKPKVKAKPDNKDKKVKEKKLKK